MPPKKRPAMTGRVEMLMPVMPGRLREGSEERQGGHGRRADREALADGGGGVADRVELVGALANLGS